MIPASQDLGVTGPSCRKGCGLIAQHDQSGWYVLVFLTGDIQILN
ncbi:hypothetical protein RchiOBHm_Chr4g0385091 [Rosa chinensis]|uniref:Uncharacterized protein n=1 Tax=Rosa chinensis TaxID=74649 RepID=A0A2P6QNU6_ROSCH|nr:hypothetical protein RchiOBHm_Chr4g0385091 [Rosa chinensis]